jgi:hypothetical protein
MVDRPPIPGRVGEVVGPTVEHVERLGPARNRCEDIVQREPKLPRQPADRVMIGVDQFAAMLGDLTLREVAA